MACERADAARFAALQNEAIEEAPAREPVDQLEAADREDELLDWLERRDVPEPWHLAPTLVSAGVDSAWLDEAAEATGAALPAALSSLVAILTARGLADELSESTERMSALVGALKEYTYMDQAPQQDVDVHRGLDNTLTILGHKLKSTEIRVDRRYAEDLPPVPGWGSQLNQVWTNLLDNAIGALGAERHDHHRHRARQRPRRRDRRRRRARHSRGRPGAGVRALLHHQGARRGHRPGPRDELPHRGRAPPRHDRGGVATRRHALHRQTAAPWLSDKPVPRDRDDDYTREAADARRQFAEEQTGASLEHVSSYSFDPAETSGNIEQFTGVAQVPLGLAGPVRSTASTRRATSTCRWPPPRARWSPPTTAACACCYETGGIKTTILDDRMQRAPAFLFAERARDARLPRLDQRELRGRSRRRRRPPRARGGCSTSSCIRPAAILYTRFNYTTGDAAGQNLTGKATQAACHWIVENNPTIEHFFLESNFATDKKSSQVNMLRTRGKRVVAEAVIPNALIEGAMRTSTEMMFRARQVSQLGGFMSGVTNNGSHSANGVTAIFIATGQDAANVAESSAAFVYAEMRENGDYYYSITIPSLIVATYGGGTGLPTQRECLELLGCYGTGKVQKFAEIVAATVLCGEISLGRRRRGRGVGRRPRPARAQPPLVSLPFQPRSLRAFSIYAEHNVNAARTLVKRFWPRPAGAAIAGFERVTGRDFPALKPGGSFFSEPSFYVGNHTALVGDGEPLPWPSHTDLLDLELELGFVLDRDVADATPARPPPRSAASSWSTTGARATCRRTSTARACSARR